MLSIFPNYTTCCVLDMVVDIGSHDEGAQSPKPVQGGGLSSGLASHQTHPRSQII